MGRCGRPSIRIDPGSLQFDSEHRSSVLGHIEDRFASLLPVHGDTLRTPVFILGTLFHG